MSKNDDSDLITITYNTYNINNELLGDILVKQSGTTYGIYFKDLIKNTKLSEKDIEELKRNLDIFKEFKSDNVLFSSKLRKALYTEMGEIDIDYYKQYEDWY